MGRYYQNTFLYKIIKELKKYFKKRRELAELKSLKH